MKIGQKLYFAGLLFSALVAGCESKRTDGGGGGGEVGGEGGEPEGGGPAGAKEAALRVAHLSPNAPRVDICLLRDRESVGPLMSTLLRAREGLDYGEVTRYLRVPEGTYTIRLVEAGSRSCERGLLGVQDVTGVALTGRGHYTAAALGLLGQNAAVPFEVRTFTDQTEPARDQARLRFIHAAPAVPPVDAGVGAGAAFQPLFRGVKFAQAGKENEREYVETDPIESAPLALRAAGTTNELASLTGLTLRAGEVTTVFAVGEPTSQTRPLDALVCIDAEQTSGHAEQIRGPLSRCTRLRK